MDPEIGVRNVAMDIELSIETQENANKELHVDYVSLEEDR